MADPVAPRRSPRAAGIVAGIAAIAGVAALVFAGIRVAELIDESDATSTTAPALATTTTLASPTTAATFDPGEMVTITDDSGVASIAVPRDWGDTSGRAWTVDGNEVGLALSAAPDLDAWYSGWGTPGVFVGVATSGYSPSLDDFSGVCTAGKGGERSGGMLTGEVAAWTRCGDEGSDFYVFVGDSEDGAVAVLVQLVSIDGDGLSYLDEILTTFRYQP
jgi:serine protease Do